MSTSPLSIVLTGTVSVPGRRTLTGVGPAPSGFTPTFDVLNGGRLCATAAGGWPFATEADALAAGSRAVVEFNATGMFPNMCEAW